MTIATNGSFSDIRVGTQSHDTNTFSGTWRIKNGVMSMTCTNRDGASQQAPLGAFFTSKIVRLDHHYWYSEMGGQTKYFAR